jgi:hypothetical protein
MARPVEERKERQQLRNSRKEGKGREGGLGVETKG